MEHGLKIQILMAVYNGSEYIKDQINSLLSMNLPDDLDYSILISEDGSSSPVFDYVKSIKTKKIKYLSNERKGGVVENFNFLLHSVDDDVDLVFFCDQDDFWLPNKIFDFLNEYNSLDEFDKCKPVLIHSDLCVADARLYPINLSMFSFQKLRKHPSFSNLLVQNSITGCVAAINRAALNVVIKSNICNSIMHDWYISLIVSALGKIIFIDKSTILYRQHGKNQIGAKNAGFLSFLNKQKKIIYSIKYAMASIDSCRKQAVNLKADSAVYSLLTDRMKKNLNDYIISFEKGFFFRFKMFFLGGVNKSCWYKNIAFFILYVFFCGNK